MKGTGVGSPVTFGMHVLTVILVGLIASITLPSCAGLDPKPMTELKLPANLSEAGKEAQKIINETNVVLTASYKVLAVNVEDELIGTADAMQYLETLNDYAHRADQAQDALNLGKIADAKTQAETLNKLVSALHRKIAEKAKETK